MPQQAHKPSMPFALVAFALCLSACANRPTSAEQSIAHQPIATHSTWTEAFQPPEALETPRFILEPLGPGHTDLDFAALQSSRQHLQTTLGWGGWPSADMTAARDQEDLVKHWSEFVSGAAYAYTVLSPDGNECLGCVYLLPLPGQEPTQTGLLYWVTESELKTELDEHLLGSLLNWMQEDWAFNRIDLPVHMENPRGLELALGLGFKQDPAGLQPMSRDTQAIMSFAWMMPNQNLLVWPGL